MFIGSFVSGLVVKSASARFSAPPHPVFRFIRWTAQRIAVQLRATHSRADKSTASLAPLRSAVGVGALARSRPPAASVS
jgi:hypothetical protein